MSLGVTLPQFTADPRVFLDAARRAEDLGLDSIWVFDHMWPLTGGKVRPAMEAWSALAWLAVVTKRIRIGTLVTRSSMRHPALLAKMAATVASIAPGRLIVGIGSGDHNSRNENEAFGLPYFAGAERMSQLTSTLAAVVRLLRGEKVTASDGFLAVDGLTASPPVDPPPPVWVAGRSRAILEAAGRDADGWNAWGGTADRFAAEAEVVRAAAGEREVELTWGGLILLDETDEGAERRLGTRNPAEYVVAGPDRMARHLGSLAAAGATHFVCTFPNAVDREPYELLAGPVRGGIDTP